MPRINLLPWRDEQRKERQVQFLIALGGATLVAILLSFLGYLLFNSMIDGQQRRNDRLRTEIKSLDKQIEEIKELDKTRSQLLTRKEIIEQLQSNRSQMVHLFDEMVKTIPDGVRLTSMKQAGDVLTLEGVAESNSRVASYMRNIDVSPWMGHSDLRKIENMAGGKDVDKKMPYVFSLDVKLRKPQDAQDGENSADAAAAPASVAPAAGVPPADKGAGPPPATPAAPAAPQPAAKPTPATGEKK
mgnify:CR=1 FL=1